MQHAHWYFIKEAKEGDYSQDVNLVFPSLFSLLSSHEELLTAVEEISGLLYERKAVSSPLLCAWKEFIGKYKLNNELKTFSIAGKQMIFIRVGLWS